MWTLAVSVFVFFGLLGSVFYTGVRLLLPRLNIDPRIIAVDGRVL
jgi:hypothetical protein